MKIFVLHYSKLTERKQHIIEQFKKQNITDYEFVECYNKEDLTETDKQLFDTNRVKLSMISLMNKHFYAYRRIAQQYSEALILEDDIILADDFANKLTFYMQQLPKDYDMLFIGDGCNLHIEPHKIKPNINIYEKCLYPTQWGGNGATRCTDSYVISNKGAIKLCKYIERLTRKITLPSDWWLNNVCRYIIAKVYCAEPTIITQGTENGTFQSSITPNKYNKIQK